MEVNTKKAVIHYIHGLLALSAVNNPRFKFLKIKLENEIRKKKISLNLFFSYFSLLALKFGIF